MSGQIVVGQNPVADEFMLPRTSICMSLLEINTRVWLNRFGPGTTLDRVPVQAWESISRTGMDLLWAMGVWAGNPETVKRCCFQPELERRYQQALTDYRVDDVVGSPYAVDHYELNAAVGSRQSLRDLRERLHRQGLLLILDFIPNHFGEGSRYIAEAPSVFLHGTEELMKQDGKTFFRPVQAPCHIIAHGKDPFFDAWSDTAQVNYFSDVAVQFMIKQLQGVAAQCDGVRCDMAMLMLNDVFERTWETALVAGGFKRPGEEFWTRAIAAVKAKWPNFIFIAEAYWDTECALRQQGFDYIYDKRFYDCLRGSTASEIVARAGEDLEQQRMRVRFIENHDEERAVIAFGPMKSKGAAVLTSTMPGMRLYHDGQFDGKAVHLPVQLGREPGETPHPELCPFYEQLLAIVRDPIFKRGQWALQPVESAGDNSHGNLIAYSWCLAGERRLVVVNYADQTSRGHVRLDNNDLAERTSLKDQLNNRNYEYARSDLQAHGLFIELPPFGAHIFSY